MVSMVFCSILLKAYEGQIYGKVGPHYASRTKKKEKDLDGWFTCEQRLYIH